MGLIGRRGGSTALSTAASPEAATTGTPLTLERSVFAPSPALLNAWLAKPVSSARFEREYTQQLRGSYKNNADLWIDLVEQAAPESMCLVGDRETVTVLFRCLVAVGADRGLVLDPEEDDLGAAVIESRRRDVLARARVAVSSEPESIAGSRP